MNQENAVVTPVVNFLNNMFRSTATWKSIDQHDFNKGIFSQAAGSVSVKNRFRHVEFYKTFGAVTQVKVHAKQTTREGVLQRVPVIFLLAQRCGCRRERREKLGEQC